MSNFLGWTDQHPGQLALYAIVFAWLLYRLNIISERKSVLDALLSEISHHKSWVGEEWHTDKFTGEESNSQNYMVFKLSTVAIDSAIERGSPVFLNNDLIPALVKYRQAVTTFNQWIDAAMQLQSNSELWSEPPDKKLIDRMKKIIEKIHTDGIGTSSTPRAFKYFTELEKSLKEESGTKLSYVIWATLGLRIFWIRKWL